MQTKTDQVTSKRINAGSVFFLWFARPIQGQPKATSMSTISSFRTPRYVYRIWRDSGGQTGLRVRRKRKSKHKRKHEHKHKPRVNRDDTSTSARKRNARLCLCLRRPGSHVAYACACVVRVNQPLLIRATLCTCPCRRCTRARHVWSQRTARKALWSAATASSASRWQDRDLRTNPAQKPRSCTK